MTVPDADAGRLASLARGDLAQLEAILDRILTKAWPSYLVVTLLQAKILWNAWLFRDLTSGDTSDYFGLAYRWYDRLADDIVWSPLYTSFYGMVLMVTGGEVYAATILHRIIIVMTATLGVLAVMRQLLPPAIALLIAMWWAVLPINFNTLYEVHLFALLPVLAAWLVAMSGQSAWSRGAALGILLAAAVLVRNELIVASLLFASACVLREISVWKRGGASGWRGWADCLGKYAIPALVAVAVCLCFYWRSDVKYPQVSARTQAKHTLNMCQAYAFGYAQRHPEWTYSPWVDCEPLMAATFGRPRPTLWQMIESNPKAVWDHVSWNVSLVPNGFQVALFDSMSGTVNPDYVPVGQSSVALYLSLAALLMVVLGATAALRDRDRWRAWFRERLSAWIILVSVFCVAVPVVLTQRPRPSYLFSATLVLMAVIGSAVHVMTDRRRAALGLKLAAVGGAVVLSAAVQPYYSRRPSGRPLYESFERLNAFAPLLRDSKDRVMLGDYGRELANYLRLTAANTLDYGELSSWDRQEDLGRFFGRKGIGVVYLQPRVLGELRTEPAAREFLSRPEVACWERLGSATGYGSGWLLLRTLRSAHATPACNGNGGRGPGTAPAQ